MARLLDTHAVHTDLAAQNETRRQRARLDEAREPEPAVDPLRLAGRRQLRLAARAAHGELFSLARRSNASRSAPSLANGESASLGPLPRGGEAETTSGARRSGPRPRSSLLRRCWEGWCGPRLGLRSRSRSRLRT